MPPPPSTGQQQQQQSPKSLVQRYSEIVAAVFAYWTCSISLVFLNKHLLSSPDLKLNAPLFVTWYQCIISFVLCLLCSRLSKWVPRLISFPDMPIDLRLSREVLPLSVVFVAMITFNNLCLKHVGVSFYYVGRSLTTVFNVACSYLILGLTTSKPALLCCLLIVAGFLLGVNQEDVAGTLSITGVIYGVLASLFVALNAIFTKKTLPTVGDSIWRMTMYNNLNACLLFPPLMLLAGEFGEVPYSPHIVKFNFWAMMSLGGFFGFIMGYVTGWQIQVTSALTHNISGTAKAAAQTVIAVAWWREFKPILWWLSNAVVLIGSAAYTWVQKKDMDRKFYEAKEAGAKYEEELQKKLDTVQQSSEANDGRPNEQV
uniref:TPT domain-containing protein n=1 Tax=Globodera pallida TaxID=36090 RepID=A0A183BJ68_GLOPA